MNSICLFCGSASGKNHPYVDLAADFGRQCAEKGLVLYYGGACIGLMEAAARAAMDHNGQVVGITPTLFSKDVVVAKNITELIMVKSMSERKQMLERKADAFVAFPGGFGTMDELFEVLTDAQIGLHHKPVAVFNAFGYYDAMLAQLDRFVQDGFLRPFHRDLLLVADSLDDLFDKLAHYQNSNNADWLKKIRS